MKNYNSCKKLFLLICPVLCFLNSCYILQQAGPFLSQRFKARKIEEVLKDPATEEKTRLFLERVLDIKEYASTVLGLKKDKNYTTYIEVKEDYVATVVSACQPFSFEAWLWDYPVVGKLPYKGFYKEKDARQEVEKLKKKGLDVWVRRVSAFSSLGYFSDPLYSYMQSYTAYDLANLIIHEQTHATIFLKNQSQFNEELASFVGDTGARLYVAARFGSHSPEYLAIDRDQQEAETYRQFILELRKKLEILYNTPGMEPEKRQQEKQQIIEKAKADFKADYDKLFTTDNYKGFSDLPVNNAYISLFSLYNQDLSLYGKLYEKEGQSIPAMIRRLKAYKGKAPVKEAMEEWVQPADIPAESTPGK